MGHAQARAAEAQERADEQADNAIFEAAVAAIIPQQGVEPGMPSAIEMMARGLKHLAQWVEKVHEGEEDDLLKLLLRIQPVFHKARLTATNVKTNRDSRMTKLNKLKIILDMVRSPDQHSLASAVALLNNGEILDFSAEKELCDEVAAVIKDIVELIVFLNGEIDRCKTETEKYRKKRNWMIGLTIAGAIILGVCIACPFVVAGIVSAAAVATGSSVATAAAVAATATTVVTTATTISTAVSITVGTCAVIGALASGAEARRLQKLKMRLEEVQTRYIKIQDSIHSMTAPWQDLQTSLVELQGKCKTLKDNFELVREFANLLSTKTDEAFVSNQKVYDQCTVMLSLTQHTAALIDQRIQRLILRRAP